MVATAHQNDVAKVPPARIAPLHRRRIPRQKKRRIDDFRPLFPPQQHAQNVKIARVLMRTVCARSRRRLHLFMSYPSSLVRLTHTAAPAAVSPLAAPELAALPQACSGTAIGRRGLESRARYTSTALICRRAQPTSADAERVFGSGRVPCTMPAEPVVVV